MDRFADLRWLRMATIVATGYPFVGITFAALADPASSEIRTAWRLGAWVACAAAFAAHLGYEHFRLRNPPLRAALHVSAAVALGAFALAVWINVHAHWMSSQRRPLAPWALVVFPVVTGLPAFVVAFVAAAVLPQKTARPGPRPPR